MWRKNLKKPASSEKLLKEATKGGQHQWRVVLQGR